jgi:hypothetical protein
MNYGKTWDIIARERREGRRRLSFGLMGSGTAREIFLEAVGNPTSRKSGETWGTHGLHGASKKFLTTGGSWR